MDEGPAIPKTYAGSTSRICAITTQSSLLLRPPATCRAADLNAPPSRRSWKHTPSCRLSNRETRILPWRTIAAARPWRRPPWPMGDRAMPPQIAAGERLEERTAPAAPGDPHSIRAVSKSPRLLRISAHPTSSRRQTSAVAAPLPPSA